MDALRFADQMRSGFPPEVRADTGDPTKALTTLYCRFFSEDPQDGTATDGLIIKALEEAGKLIEEKRKLVRVVERGIIGDGDDHDAILLELNSVETRTELEAWRHKWGATKLTVHCGDAHWPIKVGEAVHAMLGTGERVKITVEKE